MTNWQYYLDCGFGGDGEPTSLVRLAEGEPEMCAELLSWQGVWTRTSSLYRQHMRGSDYDYEPTTPERAAQVIQQWLASGRIEKLPDNSLRDLPDPAYVEQFKAGEAAARARWAAVPTPPGAADIPEVSPKRGRWWRR